MKYVRVLDSEGDTFYVTGVCPEREGGVLTDAEFDELAETGEMVMDDASFIEEAEE